MKAEKLRLELFTRNSTVVNLAKIEMARCETMVTGTSQAIRYTTFLEQESSGSDKDDGGGAGNKQY